jgi:hypothetical protein
MTEHVRGWPRKGHGFAVTLSGVEVYDTVCEDFGSYFHRV